MPPPSPHHHNTSRSTISQRVAYYLIGVAIGVVLLGFFMSNKQRARQAEQAARQPEGASERPGANEAPGTPPPRP